MLSDAEIQAAARRLHQAEQARIQIRSVSLDHPDMNIEDAYAVQHAWVKMKIAEGRRIRGRKIGLTSRAMQQAMQIDEPDYGTLLDDMFFDDGAEIDVAQFSDPRLEVELAFILGAPLCGPDLSVADVLAATDYVQPAIEIIAARSHRIDPDSGKPRGILDTISDNAANAGIILGGKRLDPNQTDLRWVSALLYRNGVIEESGVAAAVLDHPANGVVWLARKFAAHGITLDAGEVILAGSFTRPVVAQAGDDFRIDYGSYGVVTCRFP